MILAASAEVRFTGQGDGDLGRTAPGPVRAAVIQNRARLLAELGVRCVAAAHQVHGTHVAQVTEAPMGYSAIDEEADGLATALPGVAVAVHVADCLPIAIAGEGGVAILHGGWRGLAGGIAAAGVEALRELGVDGELEAAIGPGAGPCCYEVGEEVHAAFGVSGSGPLDLPAIASAQLEAAGVGRINRSDVCTICSEEFFSHRRDGESTGRQTALAWLI